MKLKAPKGVGAVSFDGVSYPVVKGVVEVPDAAQVFLEPGWGFTQVVDEDHRQDAGATKPKTGA